MYSLPLHYQLKHRTLYAYCIYTAYNLPIAYLASRVREGKVYAAVAENAGR